jgi:excisionase family DNA binding protein
MTAPTFAHHGDRLLYRVREAAQILAVSESKMWEIVLRHDIESLKLDGSRRISRQAIERYIASLEGRGDAASA